MGRLPDLPGKRVVRVFESLGWRQDRQSGSHVILLREGLPVTLSIPLHGSVAKGTLRVLIGRAGLTVDEFIEAEHDC